MEKSSIQHVNNFWSTTWAQNQNAVLKADTNNAFLLICDRELNLETIDEESQH